MDIEKIFLEKTDSTQQWAKRNSHKLDKNKMNIIVAQEQTHGKGRCKRCWFSPKKENIYATFYFLLPKDLLHLTCIGQLLCLSLARLLIKKGLSPQVKWPNDILLSNKKVAGILCETFFSQNFVEIFLGIGININMDEENLEKIDQPATSLKKETKKIWDKFLFLDELLSFFIKDLEIFKKEGFAPFHSQMENLLAYKGKQITYTDGEKKYQGIVHSISCDGEINLYFPETKKIKSFFSGDLSFIYLE